MMQFKKPALTPSKIIDKLTEQGMLILTPEQRQNAFKYFRYVGAFRLKGYWYHLFNETENKFQPNMTFENIIDRYEFDCELRGIISKGIETLEVAIRTTISNTLSQNHGPHWFLREDLFSPTKDFSIEKMLKAIEEETKRSRSVFIKHYNNTYTEPHLPPSWAITECLSFGVWSRIFSILKNNSDKNSISKVFGINKCKIFSSWLRSLTYLRNLTAHHERILGRNLTFSPKEYKSKNIIFKDASSFYSVATIMSFLLLRIKLPNNFKNSLINLFSTYPNINIKELGFPDEWELTPGWVA